MVRQTAVMVERTCDQCGKKVEYNDMNISLEQQAELGNWFAVAREVWPADGKGQVTRLLFHCCSKVCVGLLVSMDPAVAFPPRAAN